MTSGADASIKRTARLAGGLHLSLVPLGVLSFVYVPLVLVERGDAAATCRKIMAAEGLFRSGSVSHLASQIIVVFLMLALYRVFRPVKGQRAVLMVVLALVGIPISAVSEVHNLATLRVLAGAGDGAFSATQLQDQAMLFLDLGRTGVLVAQVFWGLCMFPLGALVFRSGFLPKALAIPVMIAGAGYLFDSTAQLLFPGVVMISQFTFVAELVLPSWLLIRGVSLERWQQLAVRGA